MISPQQHSLQRGSDIYFVEVQAYCPPMELASLLKVTFGLVLSVSQSLMQQVLQCLEPIPTAQSVQENVDVFFHFLKYR